MDLVERSFRGLYPEKQFIYQSRLRYSGKFRGFNGSIRRSGSSITVSMSRNWKTVSPDIQMGLVQELLAKLFRQKAHTLEMDLYNNFIRSAHLSIPKTQSHPVLESSFSRVNSRYFESSVEQPNLAFKSSIATLGSYDYGTDTISISKILLQDEELLDYVMYHEVLHKYHKYSSKGGRHFHHTGRFRKDEQSFENAEELERRLKRLVSKARWRSLLPW